MKDGATRNDGHLLRGREDGRVLDQGWKRGGSRANELDDRWND